MDNKKWIDSYRGAFLGAFFICVLSGRITIKLPLRRTLVLSILHATFFERILFVIFC